MTSKPKPMPVRLGGAAHPDFATNAGLQEWHRDLAYVWVDIGGGETLQLFYNLSAEVNP